MTIEVEIDWGSGTSKNSIALTDAIELAVAFREADYYGRFTQADFQGALKEILGDDNASYLPGDQADERTGVFEEALGLIEKRGTWLKNGYPFTVVDGEARFAPEPCANRHLPYLFLLACSNTKHIPQLNKKLRIQFENLCKEALKGLFPDWADVWSFSQYSEDRKTIFGYAADQAIPQLAKKLNANTKNEGEIPQTPREFGIDIVVVSSFRDSAPHPFFAFAQCTVAQDWWNKKHEAIAEDSLDAFIDLNTRHSNFLMIPHFPRHDLKKWSEDPARTRNCILCDRYRICRLLEKSDSFDVEDPPPSIADLFAKIRESLSQPIG